EVQCVDDARQMMSPQFAGFGLRFFLESLRHFSKAGLSFAKLRQEIHRFPSVSSHDIKLSAISVTDYLSSNLDATPFSPPAHLLFFHRPRRRSDFCRCRLRPF